MAKRVTCSEILKRERQIHFKDNPPAKDYTPDYIGCESRYQEYTDVDQEEISDEIPERA